MGILFLVNWRYVWRARLAWFLFDDEPQALDRALNLIGMHLLDNHSYARYVFFFFFGLITPMFWEAGGRMHLFLCCAPTRTLNV